MPNIGPIELAVILIIALVIFGPKKLPELGRSLGSGIREFKGSVTGENQDEDESAPALKRPESTGPIDGDMVANDRARSERS